MKIMKKNKVIVIIGIVFAFLLLLTTKVNAEKTVDGVIATKLVEGFKGNVQFNISNIPLTSEGNYVWAVGTTSSVQDITKWYSLGDFSETNKTAKISLVVSDKDILNILRTTNTAFLYVKDSKTDTLIVDALKVDLTLPSYHAFDLMKDTLGDYYIIGGNLSAGVDKWNGATYNIQNAYYKFVKVTDKSLIEKYNQAIENNTSIENVFSISSNDIEKVTDWKNCSRDLSYPYTKIEKEQLPANDGLYILYMKAKDADSKMVYGYRIWPLDFKKVETGNNTSSENNSANNDSNGNNGSNDSSKIQGGQGAQSSTTTQTSDSTTAKGRLPNAGLTKIIMSITVVLALIGIGIFIKYKKIQLK